MWMNKAIDKINKDLKKKEKKLHAQRIIDGIEPKPPIDDIFIMTDDEEFALRQFHERMQGYNPRTEVQALVLSFADRTHSYINMSNTVSNGDVNAYIRNSIYWSKHHHEKTEKLYALNEEMKCVIFKMKDDLIMTTQSSFEKWNKTQTKKDSK